MTDTPAPPQPQPQAQPQAQPQRRSRWAALVDRVAQRMAAEGGFSNGELAELRRVHPDAPFTPALWKILLTYQDDDPHRGQPEHERRWAAVFGAMALAIGQHSAAAPLGRALANAGWSELRLVRLLEAPDDELFETLRRMARFVSSRGEALDWAEVAALAHETDPTHRRTLRQRVARSYYAAAYRNAADAAEP